ncbi:hypothetical protein NHH62_32625 [Paraburkholderia fungorum]|nr:hypothetical protein [Paraburkholderia fungorum]USX07348.1 hypothetical protein NHH62_32625 [Paraburkholderia fungorum]
MSYWRKLFVIVLLILSLPVQSFAAISMKCESSHFGSDGASVQHADADEATHSHHAHGVMMADGDHHGHHHAHSCATCASCCFGVALSAIPTVATPAGMAHFAVPLPPSVNVASFLTSGIERPPKASLA